MGAFARLCATLLRGLGGVARFARTRAGKVLPSILLASLIGAAAPAMAQPVVTLQPRDVTIYQDSNAHFSVRATGASDIVWQRQEPGGSAFVNMVPNPSEWWTYGASNLQIVATGAANSGARYRAAIHGAGGTLVYSEPATLTIRTRMQITGISPAVGPVEGNTSIILAGQGFDGASKVYFGSREAQSFTVDSDTQITATTPASAAGTVDVTVLAPETSFQARAGFTFGDPGSEPPVFTAFTPVYGPVAGGNTVIITGTGLSSVDGVTVDSKAVRYSIDSDTQISIEMPPAPVNPVRRVVEIQLNSPWGSPVHTEYYVYSSAELASLFASSGTLSPAFTPNVSEYWLRVSADVSEITFTPGRAGNWLSASVNGQPHTTPVALHTGANTVAIEVTNALDGGVRTYNVTVIRPAVEPVVIASQPRLVRDNPSLPGSLTVIATGATGYTWQIHRPDEAGFRDVTWADGGVEAGGSRFAISGSVTAGSQFRVKVRGQDAQEIISDVVVLDGPNSAPVIHEFSVGSGPTTGGTEVVVSGWALSDVTAVTVGGMTVGFTPINDVSLSFVTPPAAAGTTEIVVTSPHGSDRRSFHYGDVAPTPVITNISPASLPESGGTVVISGSNFTGTEVHYGGGDIDATIDSDSQITAILPPGAVGEVTLYVSTPWETSAGWPLPRYYQGTLLSGLTLSSGQLSPAFNSYASHYNVAVPDDVAQITLTPTALRYGPGITVNGQTVASGQASQPIALAYGDNAIAVEVRSANDAQTRQIMLTITRASAPAVIVSHPRSIQDNGQALTLSVVAENAIEYIWGRDGSGFLPLDPSEATGLGTPTITLTSGSQQSYRVAVRGTDGNLVFSDAATVSSPVKPQHLYVFPDTGPASGGNWVRIGELDFTGVTGVRFGGEPALAFSMQDDTTLLAQVPAGTPGGVELAVDLPSGTVARNAAYHYGEPVHTTVTGIEPDHGPISGGHMVVVSGENLDTINAIVLGPGAGIEVPFTRVSPTRIEAVMPDLSHWLPAGTETTLPLGLVKGYNPTTFSDERINVPYTLRAPDDALVSLVVSGAVLNPPFSADVTSYTARAPGGTSEVTINAVTRHASTLTFNGTPVASGMPTPPISLTGGAVTATLVVASADGGTSRTYTIALDRLASESATIVTDPQDVTIKVGATARFSVTADNAASYSWEVSGDGGVSYTSVANGTGTGANTPTLTTVPAPQPLELLFRVVVRGADGVAITSHPARLRVVPAPTIASLTPSSGPLAGGNEITVSGVSLAGVTQVSVGGNPATGIVVVSDEQLRARVPAGVAGPVDVTVAGSLGSSTLYGGYIYAAPAPPPTVSSVTPSQGPAGGGTPVVILGTNFVSVIDVSIGGQPATDVRRVSNTQIAAVTPVGLAGPASVVVTTGSGSGELANGFTYLPTPVIASITPDEGVVSGGTSVVISGTNFADVTDVTFGGHAASFVIDSNSQIRATTPLGLEPGAVDVVVAGAEGSDTSIGGFTYRAPPTIASVTPDSGPTTGDTQVTIDGSGFTADSTVTFGGVAAASVTVHSDTSLSVQTPSGSAGAVDITVTTPFGSATQTAGFTYMLPPPSVTSVSPAFGPLGGGIEVTIAGDHFTGVVEVRFGANPATAFTYVSPTQITATVPAGGSGPVDVTVTTAEGTGSLADGFAYVAPPTFDNISPDQGHPDGGEEVVITGTGFVPGTTVTIGGNAATVISIDSPTQLTARTPYGWDGGIGAVDVVVTTDFGTVTGTGAYTYRVLPPVITSVSPNQGPVSGGTGVVITGTDLADAHTVIFGTHELHSFTVENPTRITLDTPAGIEGPVDVIVTTPFGTATMANGFTYVVPSDFVFDPGEGALPEAMAGEAYQQPITATGGVAPMLYSLDGGAMPAGMVLNLSTGEITGPLDADTEGDYSFTVAVRDAIGATGRASYTLAVKPRAVTVPNKQQSVPAGATPLPIYLNEGATGGPFTGALVSFVEPPQAGTAEITEGDLAQAGGSAPVGWYLKFTPDPDYSGTARVGYRLISALGTSNTGVITFTLAYDPDAVVSKTHALVQGFVQSRLGMIASNVKVPGLVERRAMGSADARVSTSFSPSEGAMVMNFATSLVQMEAARIGQAGIVEATDIPFNAWIDGTFMLHSRSPSNDRWGSFAMLSAGVDYLLTDKILVGLAFHYDRMNDPTDGRTTLAGNGWLLGPYASLEIGSGVFWDSSVFFGGSANTIDMLSWNGEFDTSRWLVDTALEGQWRLDEATVLTPRLRMVYLSETVQGYAITNSAGDVLSLQGFTTEQLRIGVGAALAREFTLENGVVFTPSLDVDVGITPLNGTGYFGTIAPGVSWRHPDAWTIDGRLQLNVDSSGALSAGIKGGIRGGF